MLDAAQRRMVERAQFDFSGHVEASRAGWIFAHDDKQYQRWKHATSQAHSAPLDDRALELAIMNIARQFPDNVVVGPR